MFTFQKVLFNRYCNMKALYSNRYGKYSVACCAQMIANTPHDKNKILITYILEVTGRM